MVLYTVKHNHASSIGVYSLPDSTSWFYIFILEQSRTMCGLPGLFLIENSYVMSNIGEDSSPDMGSVYILILTKTAQLLSCSIVHVRKHTHVTSNR